MNNYLIKSNINDKKLDQDFLRLPKILYDKLTIHQNYDEEKMILNSSHPLSHYFSFTRFVLYCQDQPVGRALLIKYPDQGVCYLGYYECIDDNLASKILLDKVTQKAADLVGVRKIIGPYNVSFWLSYRLKLDNFNESPYTTEPSNKSYYEKQLISAGYLQKYSYISNEYKLKYSSRQDTSFNTATKRAHELKYIIKSPKKSEFISSLERIYELFTELYSDFPGYIKITKQEFVEMFKGSADVLDYSFVKFAYSDNQVVGFVVGFPDYGNLPYRPMTFLNRLRIVLRRIRSGRYIVTYLGVLPEHSGLGKALVRSLSIQAALRGAKVVGALILAGKVTEKYAEKMISKQYKYGLFEKEI